LPFIVTATQIGLIIGLMTPVTATALVCAGLLSVLAFPAVALRLLRPSTRRPAGSGDTLGGTRSSPAGRGWPGDVAG